MSVLRAPRGVQLIFEAHKFWRDERVAVLPLLCRRSTPAPSAGFLRPHLILPRFCRSSARSVLLFAQREKKKAFAPFFCCTAARASKGRTSTFTPSHSTQPWRPLPSVGTCGYCSVFGLARKERLGTSGLPRGPHGAAHFFSRHFLRMAAAYAEESKAVAAGAVVAGPSVQAAWRPAGCGLVLASLRLWDYRSGLAWPRQPISTWAVSWPWVRKRSCLSLRVALGIGSFGVQFVARASSLLIAAFRATDDHSVSYLVTFATVAVMCRRPRSRAARPRSPKRTLRYAQCRTLSTARRLVPEALTNERHSSIRALPAVQLGPGRREL